MPGDVMGNKERDGRNEDSQDSPAYVCMYVYVYGQMRKMGHRKMNGQRTGREKEATLKRALPYRQPPPSERMRVFQCRFDSCSSRARARSARSTPTRILLAFQPCTRLMTFLPKHTGKVMIAMSCGHVTWATSGANFDGR